MHYLHCGFSPEKYWVEKKKPEELKWEFRDCGKLAAPYIPFDDQEKEPEDLKGEETKGKSKEKEQKVKDGGSAEAGRVMNTASSNLEAFCFPFIPQLIPIDPGSQTQSHRA
jgi:hypothetical protein